MSDLEPGAPSPSAWRERVELLSGAAGRRAGGLRPSTGQAVGGAVLVAVLAAVGWLLLRPPVGPPIETVLPLASSAGSSSSTTATTADEVVVHAAGAVASPGVYRLAAGARVADLLDAAGGPTPDADVDQLNLAAVVTDGERIYVPRAGEVVLAPPSPGGDEAPAGPLDLNTATLDQLDALPGVGPATARAIVDERERRGGFRSIEDLLDVRGIGPAKLEALRDLVRVS